jgi:hypothetical protein
VRRLIRKIVGPNMLTFSAIEALIGAALLSLLIDFTTSTSALAGTIVGTTTPAPNNDDYTGTFPGPNVSSTLNFTGFDSDVVLSVAPSGGTTEYSFQLAAILSAPTTAIHVELGFGTGSNFVSAASVVPGLDFDAPLPGLPAPKSSAFPIVNAQPYLIEYSGGTADGSVFDLADFELDVPDFPASITSFTLRERTGPAVPEPSTIAGAGCGLATVLLAALLRRKVKEAESNKSPGRADPS